MVEVLDFAHKSADVVRSAVGGVTTHPSRSIELVAYDRYQSYQEYPNPPIDLLEYEIASVISQSNPNILRKNITTIPWGKKPFSKGRHLQVMVGFADQHRCPYTQESFPPELAKQFVDRVFNASGQLHRQTTLYEQLKIALEICPDSIIGASVIAHAGSRAIARNGDTRISPLLKFTREQTLAWHDSVSSFRELTTEFGGSPADTYHFWGTFIAGLVSTIAVQYKDRALNHIYQFLYLNMAEITSLLHNKIAGHGNLPTHQQVDAVGYHLGSFVADYLLVK